MLTIFCNGNTIIKNIKNFFIAELNFIIVWYFRIAFVLLNHIST